MTLQASSLSFPWRGLRRQIREFCRTLGYSVSEIFFHCGDYNLMPASISLLGRLYGDIDDFGTNLAPLSRGDCDRGADFFLVLVLPQRCETLPSEKGT
jgi:hypothetical protein